MKSLGNKFQIEKGVIPGLAAFPGDCVLMGSLAHPGVTEVSQRVWAGPLNHFSKFKPSGPGLCG